MTTPACVVRPTTVEGLAGLTLADPRAGLEATFVPEANMAGVSLRWRGVELLDPRDGLRTYLAHGTTMGLPILYPWANRLAGHGYAAAGRAVDLRPHRDPLCHDGAGLPIHGLHPAALRWEVMRTVATASGAALHARLAFRTPGLLAVFPYPHDLELEAVLHDGRLDVTATVHATGGVPVPVSFGFHPYFRLPGRRADWVLTLPARQRLVLDGRMLPTGTRVPAEVPAAPLGCRAYDDAFTDFPLPAVVTLAGAGLRLRLTLDCGYPFVQIYAPPADAFVCIEPMTAPANALVSGTDLPVVAPGTTFVARFAIAVDAC